MPDLENEWFKEWFNSPYYHMLYENRDETEAAAFIDRLVEHLHPNADARMLDIACGKGRHSIQLASKGYDVTGIDISPSSILEALSTTYHNTEFFVHDMRHPFRINYYDYAFNFFTSFGYFDTYRDHLNAIRSMTLSLKPGGCFIMDYLNPSYIQNNLQSFSEIKKGATVFHLERSHDQDYFYKKIRIEIPDKNEPLIYMEKVANFDLIAFKEMFALNGLILQDVFGDYTLHSFIETSSPRMIMIFRKDS
jgi:SAM-dependent methyltransferase